MYESRVRFGNISTFVEGPSSEYEGVNSNTHTHNRIPQQIETTATPRASVFRLVASRRRQQSTGIHEPYSSSLKFSAPTPQSGQTSGASSPS